MESCQIGPRYIPVPVVSSTWPAQCAKIYTQAGTRLHQVTVILKYAAATLCVLALVAMIVKKYLQSQHVQVTEPPPLPWLPHKFAPEVRNARSEYVQRLYTDKSGWTPLMDAALRGQVDGVKSLLDTGVDITLRNENGVNALMAAAAQNNTEVMALLLTPEVADKDGRTALKIAVQQNNVEGVRVLLTGPGLWMYNASAESKRKALQLALYYRDYTKRETDPRIVQMLEEAVQQSDEWDPVSSRPDYLSCKVLNSS